MSSIARSRLNASYFSGEFSEVRLTEGLEEVFGVMGVVGEERGMERGEPIPESTECGWWELLVCFPDNLRAPRGMITLVRELLG